MGSRCRGWKNLDGSAEGRLIDRRLLVRDGGWVKRVDGVSCVAALFCLMVLEWVSEGGCLEILGRGVLGRGEDVRV